MMTKQIKRTFNNYLKCVLKTQVNWPRGILFLSQLQKIRDLASEKNAFYKNLMDEINKVIKEFLEIDRNTKNNNFLWEP